MKAAQYNQYGGVEVITINESASQPVASQGKVLVAVKAASLNPFDWKLRAGFFKDYLPLPFPITIGGDFSGTITEVGEGVTEFAAGDDVFGQASVVSGGSGSLAEFVVASAGKIAHKPQFIDHLQAAALPLVGVSAIQALEDHIKLQSGQKILIHGGSGGIGSIAIQLAKQRGAYVATTVSSQNVAFATSLGADEVIDYTTQKFEEMLADFDAVFDTVGGEIVSKSFPILKKNGILVSMAGKPDEKLAEQYSVIGIGQNTDGNTEKLRYLASLVDQGAVRVQVDTVFSLHQTKEAFAHLETGHPRGKIVVKVNE